MQIKGLKLEIPYLPTKDCTHLCDRVALSKKFFIYYLYKNLDLNTNFT